jgi:hypothetical protein
LYLVYSSCIIGFEQLACRSSLFLRASTGNLLPTTYWLLSIS